MFVLLFVVFHCNNSSIVTELMIFFRGKSYLKTAFKNKIKFKSKDNYLKAKELHFAVAYQFSFLQSTSYFISTRLHFTLNSSFAFNL